MSWTPHRRTAVAGLLAAALAGCAAPPAGDPLDDSRQALARLSPNTPADALARADAARTEALLGQPLASEGAVELALRHSPALAALLARARADEAEARRAGRLADPVFSFERLHGGGELAIARTLSIGLWELLTLPQRQQDSAHRVAAGRLRAAAEVVDQVGAVRQAWVTAVATRQAEVQAERVLASAQAGAELARRMQAAGNLNKLAGARQQLFLAEAQAQRQAAAHASLAGREALARALGLDDAQAARLQLPERLPELPTQALTPQALAPAAAASRLDLRLAQAELDAASAARGWGRIASVADVELAGRLENSWADGTGSRQRGAELSLRLPLADGGSLQRQALDARTEAALLQREAVQRAAGSQLREAHAAWLSAWTLARHQQDTVLPLRQAIADETLLHYNGMLLGIFELLADAREQAAAVQAAIAAQAQFWHADAALQASLLGRPQGLAIRAGSPSTPAAEAGH